MWLWCGGLGACVRAEAGEGEAGRRLCPAFRQAVERAKKVDAAGAAPERLRRGRGHGDGDEGEVARPAACLELQRGAEELEHAGELLRRDQVRDRCAADAERGSLHAAHSSVPRGGGGGSEKRRGRGGCKEAPYTSE